MPEDLSKPHLKYSRDSQVIAFIIMLCLICGLSLAITSFVLQNPQDEARSFDRNKQMMIAAKLLNTEGYFEIFSNEVFVKAHIDKAKKILIEDPLAPKATIEEIKEEANWRIRSLLIDEEGNITTFEDQNLSLDQYLIEYKKIGYAYAPLKLFYAILPNQSDASYITEKELASNLSKAESFVFPVSGFGLWAPIYGYLAISADGNTVLGTTWYEHGETPGLGANITEDWWQRQFYGKVIFHESANGTIDFTKAPLGIIVVRGKVRDIFGSSVKAKSAVDGISGASFTGDGVTAAYRDCLLPYRDLLIKIHKTHSEDHEK